uniref:Uncharacterized protein n=1 Tax=Chrysotila carterae TaxID=13221 RepID=A0A6S9TGQ6_CHRCT
MQGGRLKSRREISLPSSRCAGKRVVRSARAAARESDAPVRLALRPRPLGRRLLLPSWPAVPQPPRGTHLGPRQQASGGVSLCLRKGSAVRLRRHSRGDARSQRAGALTREVATAQTHIARSSHAHRVLRFRLPEQSCRIYAPTSRVLPYAQIINKSSFDSRVKDLEHY